VNNNIKNDDVAFQAVKHSLGPVFLQGMLDLWFWATAFGLWSVSHLRRPSRSVGQSVSRLNRLTDRRTVRLTTAMTTVY